MQYEKGDVVIVMDGEKRYFKNDPVHERGAICVVLETDYDANDGYEVNITSIHNDDRDDDCGAWVPAENVHPWDETVAVDIVELYALWRMKT